eukprot:14608524-Alexandrium_andersonii.AAC.1
MRSKFAWCRRSASLSCRSAASRCVRRPMAERRWSAARRPKPAGSGRMTSEAGCVPEFGPEDGAAPLGGGARRCAGSAWRPARP